MLEIRNMKLSLDGIVIDIPYMRVENGEYLTIIGMTGAGKTVLLETIAGFHRMERGEILVDGRRIKNLPPNRRKIALVYQDFMLFPHLTVRQNIEYGLRIRGEKMDVDDIAKKLEIWELMDRYPGTLSGGEKQRVAIARALVVKPEILLMDEPFSSLDVKTRERARKIVKRVVEEYGMSVIHVTHDFEDVFLLADRVVVMKDGRIIQHGTVEEVFMRPGGGFIADFVSTNVLRCRTVGREKNITILDCNGVRLYTADIAHGEVMVSIRPEEIIISPQKNLTSARNALRGTVVDVERRGNLVWITVDVGVKLRVVITPNSMELLGIKKDKRIYCVFKASSLKVIG